MASLMSRKSRPVFSLWRFLPYLLTAPLEYKSCEGRTFYVYFGGGSPRGPRIALGPWTAAHLHVAWLQCPILKVFSMEGVPLWNAFILERISVKCTFHECVFSARLCTWLVFWALTFQEVYQSHHASLGWKGWEIFKIRNHRLRIIVCLKRVFLLLGIFSWQLPYKTEPWQFWLFLTPEIWCDTVWSSPQF